MNKFYVIGSLNMDLIIPVPHFPVAGETIIGNELQVLPGGKGANQAVALARLGADVTMFGKMGKDQYADSYLDILQKEKVKSAHIQIEENVSTGLAIIEVEQRTSQNRIVVIPGANDLVDAPYIAMAVDYIVSRLQQFPQQRHTLLLQLEIPLESIALVLDSLAPHKNLTIMLDPAPVPTSNIPKQFYAAIDYITPNETETEKLTNIQIRSVDDIKRAADTLLAYGCRNVIIKAGEQGAYFVSEDNVIFAPQHNDVVAIDTTAAGDSFNAGFAYALSMGDSVADSLDFANKVAGLSTTKPGAQGAMPKLRRDY